MINHLKKSFSIVILSSICLFYSPIFSYSHTQHKFYDYKANEEASPDWPDEQRLIVELLKSYDPAARPVFNASKSVPITFSLSLIQISDMDEKNQILTANVWLEQVIE